jgi:hypothetical protein
MVVLADAELARSRKNAEQIIVTAQAEAEQRSLAGKGEASRIAQIGLSEAAVLLRKVQSYADPRLYALTQAVAKLADSKQPLVPERVFMAGGQPAAGNNGSPDPNASAAQGLLGLLLSLMVAEKSGFDPAAPGVQSLDELAEKLTREAIAEPAAPAPVASPPGNSLKPKPIGAG